LLDSPIFKKANIDSPAKEEHGINQWLLHNMVFVFIVKAGKADLTNLYARKQDGVVINNFYKPKDSADTCPFFYTRLSTVCRSVKLLYNYLFGVRMIRS
jgi:hypothetical protein